MNKKRIVDIFMMILMILLMAVRYTGIGIHQFAGIGVFILFIIHNVLNINWYKNLTKGSYSLRRWLIVITNFLLILFMLLTVFSGVLMSGLFPYNILFARQIHAFVSLVFLILLVVHVLLNVKIIPFSKIQSVGLAFMAVIFVISVAWFFLPNSEEIRERVQQNTNKIEMENKENNQEDEYIEIEDGDAEELVETPNTSVGETKALVVYYSMTGNTKRVANIIAEGTGADIFEIETTTSGWNFTADEIVSLSVENWEEYDVIYLGYPIWRGQASDPMQIFVEENDFTGKRVIPFCTSDASGIGTSAEILYSKTQTGDWVDGYSFFAYNSEDEILNQISE